MTSARFRARFRLKDLLAEALAGLFTRPGRSLLTALGAVLGIASLVATLGIAETAGAQIVTAFDELAATSVVVTNERGFFGGETRVALPWDSEERIARLNGVIAAGTMAEVNLAGRLTSAVPVNDPLGLTEFQVPMIAASPGLLAASLGELSSGRWFDSGHSVRADRVAVLGNGVAQRLNVTRVDQQPVVFVGDDSYVVLGILEDVRRQPELLNSIIVPEGTARELYELESPTTVQIHTEIGAASLISTQAPIAVSPDDPGAVQVQAPLEPEEVRADVEEDVNALFLMLGGVSLLVGAIGIANVTLVSVLERVGEIGLRRALGAGRRHIAYQFLLESTGVGFFGGVIGASLGVLVVVSVSAVRTWTPVMDARIALAAPLLGGLVGLVAGLYPAWRASRMAPVDSLRAGMG
ncbi:MAG: ABC transporter permease [Acidimicrobiia bacterium]|nr:ABC transporter permease [bacterium]MXX64001.1 ABC transporter permease [Acidimicrobiia bacterium]MCY3579460.1 ABC transporter permease [bacterium]MCY3651532.1 ABC transporter permease [bacterium]MDE0642592.1 ABC transporter permease [bacterium]